MAACLTPISPGTCTRFDICKWIFSQRAKVYLPVSRTSTALGFVEGLEGCANSLSSGTSVWSGRQFLKSF